MRSYTHVVIYRKRIINDFEKSRTASNEIEDCKRCINLYVEGNNLTDIHNKLHRTRNWVYKWIKRYKSGDPDMSQRSQMVGD